MLIDWFTVGAQALNFLILVWLLKRFLYQPILHAIDAREKLIAKELADAAAKKAEAQKERDDFQHKNEEFDQQRAALLSKATDEAKAERLRLLEEARKAADALSAKRQETLRTDAHNLNQAISRRTQQEVFAITRKALADLATTSLEERLGEVFTRRLREMGGPAKETLGKALKTAADPALVRSAFDLPAAQRAAIQNALNETFSADIHLRFETAPDLVGGIELTANGQKVAWSIADYLSSLEKGVDELLKEKDKPPPKPEHKPEVKTEPKVETKAEPKPEAKPETKVEVAAPATPEVKAESKPEAKSQPTPAVGAAPKPVESKAEPKTEVKTAPPAVAKAAPEPTVAAVPKAEAKPEPKAEAVVKAQPVVSAQAQTETTPASKAEAKPGAVATPQPEPAATIKANSETKSA
jgi:F-type H+-transporting ATPase subunit b